MALDTTTTVDPGGLETMLRNELQAADNALANVAPILRHLLSSDDSSIFSDEIVARVRGMLDDIAQQLVVVLADAAGHDDAQGWAHQTAGDLCDVLAGNPDLLGHLHALALEWKLTERLHGRIALDPVLSPLLQGLIASPESAVSTLAMNLLAAQARFGQAQRRMQLPVTELPGEMFHFAIMAMRSFVGDDPLSDSHAAVAERVLRDRFDEARNRFGLLNRLVAGMGGEAVAALSVEEAGVAMFLTALAIASGESRDAVMIAATESQAARLALLLSASGMKVDGITRQFHALHPDILLPVGLSALRPDRAAAILATAGLRVGA
jgi:hypothetical protein